MTETWIDRTRRRMAELGVTQADLMEPLGVNTRGAVGHYMTGRREPSLAQFAALAERLGMTTDELLLRAPSPNTFHERLEVTLRSSTHRPWSSNADLARKLGVSAPTAHGWVHGTHLPTPDKAQVIADLLGVSFDWLYFGKGSNQRRPGGDSRPLHLALEEIANRPSMKMTSKEFVELVREKAAQIERYS